MISSRIISILILMIFGLTLGSEFFSSHDLAASCGAPESVSIGVQANDQYDGRFADLECPSEQKEVPCSDPCHQGYCHLGHCSHLTVASVPQIKVSAPLQIYGFKYERHIPTQHPSSIFRPPIA